MDVDIDVFENMQAAIQLQKRLAQIDVMRELGVEDIPASEVLQTYEDSNSIFGLCQGET